MVVQNLLWSASFPVTVHLCSPYILYWSFFVYSIYVTNHLNCCLSIIYIINYAFNSWLLPSFLILSFLVTHLILLNYFISVDPFHYLLSHINRSEGNIDDDLFCKYNKWRTYHKTSHQFCNWFSQWENGLVISDIEKVSSKYNKSSSVSSYAS